MKEIFRNCYHHINQIRSINLVMIFFVFVMTSVILCHWLIGKLIPSFQLNISLIFLALLCLVTVLIILVFHLLKREIKSKEHAAALIRRCFIFEAMRANAKIIELYEAGHPPPKPHSQEEMTQAFKFTNQTLILLLQDNQALLLSQGLEIPTFEDSGIFEKALEVIKENREFEKEWEEAWSILESLENNSKKREE